MISIIVRNLSEIINDACTFNLKCVFLSSFCTVYVIMYALYIHSEKGNVLTDILQASALLLTLTVLSGGKLQQQPHIHKHEKSNNEKGCNTLSV